MMIFSKQHLFRRSVYLRLGLLLVLAVTAIAFGRRSSAEFEISQMSASATVKNVQFRGVWAYSRGNLNFNEKKEGYEAYAVGINRDISECPSGAPATDCNGVFYFYNGSNWQNIPNIFFPGSSLDSEIYNNGVPYTLNAVTGQGDSGQGNPSPLFVAGSDGRIGIISGYYTTPGKTITLYENTVEYPAQFKNDTVSGLNTGETRDFYTIDAAQTYNGEVLAGGEKGLYATTNGKGAISNSPAWTVTTPTTICSIMPCPLILAPDENIIKIRFSGTSTAYILTSTPASDGTVDPFQYKCETSDSSQITRLYKTTKANAEFTQWTRLMEIPGPCGYDLTIGKPAASSSPNAIPATIWIATSNGVYKFLDDGFSSNAAVPLSGTSGKQLYAVSAIPNRGGSGVNLLTNGDFKSKSSATKADGWTYYDEHPGKDPWCTADNGSCGLSPVPPPCSAPSDYSYDSNNSVVVWQQPTKDVNNQPCLNFSKPNPLSSRLLNEYYTSGLVQNIDLSTFEGQKFKITGTVRVEFPAIPAITNATPGPQPNAPAPQGGVAIGCAGALNSGTVYQNRKLAYFLNCSLSNRSNILTSDQLTAGGQPGTTISKNFELTLSREDVILSKLEDVKEFIENQQYPPYWTGRNQGFTSKGTMYLSIRCEATYGAKVTCSNLRVEEVNDPIIPRRDRYTVIAAGQDLVKNGIFINNDALSSPNFGFETIPASMYSDCGPITANCTQKDSVTAMFGLSMKHVYAVGRGDKGSAPSGIIALNRTPSTLKGTLWVGAESPVNAGTTPLGSISVSCIDDRDSNLKTLCARSPDSYGVSIETKRLDSVTTGTITGRAWFGHPMKPTPTISTNPVRGDEEALDLGKCLRPPGQVIIPSEPYALSGLCNTTSRRCKVDASSDTLVSCTTDSCTDNSCTNNFDCYGRCQRDEGFLCVKDDDCRITATLNSKPVTSPADTLGTSPSKILSCNSTSDTIPGSPLACSSVGWLSFNQTDFSNPKAGDPPIGGSYNTLFTDHNTLSQQRGAHELSGWARFITLASSGTTGWVKLRGDNVTPAPAKLNGKDSLYACQNCAGNVNVDGSLTCAFCTDRDNHSCVPPDKNASNSPGNPPCYNVCEGSNGAIPSATGRTETPGDWKKCTPGNNTDCSAISTTNGTQVCKSPGVCSETKLCTANADCGTGIPCIKGVCSSMILCEDNTDCAGTICDFPIGATSGQEYCQAPSLCTSTSDCKVINNSAYNKSVCQNKGAICNSTGASCAQYGVNLNTETAQFSGNAWSEDFGWINFSQISTGGNPSLQTKLGDIYSSGPIGSDISSTALGEQNCAATYVITSVSSITNFCSFTGQLVPDSSKIPLISAENSYSNVLGRLDVKGIETVTTGGVNKFGSHVAPLTLASGVDITSALTGKMKNGGSVLGGQVFVVGAAGGTTTYTLGTKQFDNSASLASSGSGAGILIINGNLTITGSLGYGTSTVTDLRQLASLMVIVKGDLKIANDVSNVVGAYYVQKTVSTTDELENNNTPLVFHGLMIANQFEFNRLNAGTLESPKPSELMIYDGRIQSNAMPGLTDFSSALPNSSRVTP